MNRMSQTMLSEFRYRILFKYLYFSLIALHFFSGSVSAQESRFSETEALISYAVNPSSDYSRNGRANFAAILSVYCKKSLEILPTNSPSEDAWLQAEMKTSDLIKAERVFRSKEYSRDKLKEIFLRCQRETKRLMETSQHEALWFVSLAIAFNDDSHELSRYANWAGLNSVKLGFDFLTAIRRSILIAAMRGLEEKY